jgi:hypothetical protein
MTQAQHTPGPWILTEENQVTDREGRMIAREIFGHNVRSMAFERGTKHTVVEDDGGAANAHLIAASVDLLEAAQKALDFIQSLPYEPSMAASTRAQDALVAAIAKARGQE